MNSTTYITLDMQAPETGVIAYAKQNDKLSRRLSATLKDGATSWTPPTGAAAAIRYSKPDGTGGFYDVLEDSSPAIVVTGNVALMTLAEQCVTVPGQVRMELNFYTSAGAKLTSFTWLLNVEASVLTDATIVSSSYYNVLTGQVAQALEYRDAAANSATAAAASAALAQQISQQSKGWYATDTALKAAFPTGQNGWWAIVGAGDNIWTWDADTSAWVNTHTQTDLSNYYTKPQADAAFAPILTGCPTGSLMPFAGAAAPTGWLVATGAAVSRATYAALFTVIGTTYGAGDGNTTFNLPDLRGRVPVGCDTELLLASTTGAKTHTLTANQLPVVKAPLGVADGTKKLAINAGTSSGYRLLFDTASAPNGATNYNELFAYFGGGQAHNNMQPSIGINYIIKF